MPTEFTHAQYIKSKKEILNDTGFVEEYITLDGVVDQLMWIANFDNGFNATIDQLDAAIKTSVPMRSITGNLTTGNLTVFTAVDNGGGANVWNNPNQVYVLNGSYADSHLDAAERSTNFLKCTNLGFIVPTGATITDVYATPQGYFAGNGNASLSGKIVKGGVIGGTQTGAAVLTSITPTFTSPTKTCGTAADAGGGLATWTNPTNAQGAADSTFASVDTWGGNSPSNYLKCTNFGFAETAGDVITNVKIRVRVKTDAFTVANVGLSMVLGGTIQAIFDTIVTDLGSSEATAWYEIDYLTNRTILGSDVNLSTFGVALQILEPGGINYETIDAVEIILTTAPYTSFPAVTIGGGLWGNTLTPSDINAGNFGVALQCQNSSGDNTIYIDQVKMEVKYHLDASSEFTTTIKINPQGLGWETLATFTDSYTVGSTSTTKTHQEALIKLGAELTNAKAPFKVGLFLSVPGEIQYKNISMDGSYMMMFGASE